MKKKINIRLFIVFMITFMSFQVYASETERQSGINQGLLIDEKEEGIDIDENELTAEQKAMRNEKLSFHAADLYKVYSALHNGALCW